MRKYQALQGKSSTNSIDEHFFWYWTGIALKEITRKCIENRINDQTQWMIEIANQALQMKKKGENL